MNERTHIPVREVAMTVERGRGPSNEREREELRELVRKHEVVWVVTPEDAYVGGQRRQVGFLVSLFAAHHQPHQEPEPSCPDCLPVQHALMRIIREVLPAEERDSLYFVHVRSSLLTYSGLHGSRPDVVAQIEVLHKTGADQPIDACEVRCLHDILTGLASLGAREGPALRAA